MSYQSMLTDRCDIFHITSTPSPAKYGVPSEQQAKKMNYPDLPDAANVACYFTPMNATYDQKEPNRTSFEQFRVHFMPFVDIRLNDKVMKDGIEYRLQTPRKVKNHHWEVVAIREGNV